MKSLFTGLAACAIALYASHAVASTHKETGEPVHYEVAPPKTEQDALTMLNAKTAEIGSLLKKAQFDDNDLESVHEKTYSLEAAVEKLREHETAGSETEALDATDEAVQALHSAAENHKEPETREWFAKLQPAVSLVKTTHHTK